MKKAVLIILALLISLSGFSQTWHRLNNSYDSTYVICSYYDSTTQEIYLGGRFSSFNGVNAKSIVKWNGSQWQAMGDGFSITGQLGFGVYAITKYKGNIVAAGKFDSSGTTPFKMPIAKWNGTQWLPFDTITVNHPLGGTQNPYINALAAYNNKLYALGEMSHFQSPTSLADFRNFAVWNDTNWQRPVNAIFSVLGTLGGGRLAVYNNELYLSMIVGIDTCPGSGNPATNFGYTLIKYNPVCKSLSPVGTAWGSTDVQNMLSWNGSLYLALHNLNPTYGYGITRFDGTNFYPLGTGLNAGVESLTIYQGQLVAGGRFTSDGANSQPMQHVAKWDGTSWLPLNSQCSPPGWLYFVSGYNNTLFGYGGLDSCGGNYIGFSGSYPNSLTGLQESVIPKKEVTIYPNPATQAITVKYSKAVFSAAQINVKDILGKQLLSKQLFLQKETTLDVSKLTKGIYFIEIKHEGITDVVKFVKE